MWQHGYYTGTAYVPGYYREMAPNWIDFAALLAGQPSPRAREGAPFACLDLGSGLGFGLCLLAAAYPEGTFVGVDLMPGHIHASERLAARLGIGNVSFLEGDFLALAADPSPLDHAGIPPGSCAYVLAHGIASWIAAPVQEALLQLAAAQLCPGGLFYCSINTQPGWLARSVYQHLVQRELDRAPREQPETALKRAAEWIGKLRGPEDSPSPLALHLPSLAADVQDTEKHHTGYLLQEYGNRSWQPLFVADWHGRCSRHQFRYVGSATLPENFPELLPDPLVEVLRQEPDPAMRETLQDIAVMKAFRRDLFVRGGITLTRPEHERLLDQVQLRRTFAPACESYGFTTSFGRLEGEHALFSRIEETLAGGPRGLMELAALTGQELSTLLRNVALLIDAGRLGIDRPNADATAAAHRLNPLLLHLFEEGYATRSLLAPAIGTALPIRSLEIWLIPALQQGLEGELLVGAVALGASMAGITITDAEGKPFPDDESLGTRISEEAEKFRRQRLPVLRELGVLPG